MGSLLQKPGQVWFGASTQAMAEGPKGQRGIWVESGRPVHVRSEKEGLGRFPARLPFVSEPFCESCQHCECRMLGRVNSVSHTRSGKATLSSSLSEWVTSSISPCFLKSTPQRDELWVLSPRLCAAFVSIRFSTLGNFAFGPLLLVKSDTGVPFPFLSFFLPRSFPFSLFPSFFAP